MQGAYIRQALAAVLILAVVSGFTVAGEIHSTMRNVNAVMEAHGFSVQPAPDVAAQTHAGDLSPTQVFEIMRPSDKPVTIGRLFTSCSCIQLETNKRTFRPGERAVLQLRNIRPTPPQGQVYAIFVQITSPIRTTLRFDTFVQSGSGNDTADHNPQATNHAGDISDDELVDSALPDDGDDADSSSTVPPAVQLPEGATTIADATAELQRDIESLLNEHREAAQGVDEGGDAAREAMDSYFQQNASDMPDLAGGLNDDIPDFYAPTEPIQPPAASPVAPAAETAPTTTPEAVPETPTVAALPIAPPAADNPSVVPPAADDSTPGLTAADTALAEASAASIRAAAEVAPTPARDPNAKKPVQAVSLITIGVRDMAASISFYEGLGWRRAARGKYDQTAFFQLQGQILALYPMNDLLREQNMVGATPAPGGITLALHVSDKADVWAVYQRFIDAGGEALRPPAEVASGAVSCYVADPDGNAWEISWVPQFRIDDDGGLWLP